MSNKLLIGCPECEWDTLNGVVIHEAGCQYDGECFTEDDYAQIEEDGYETETDERK